MKQINKTVARKLFNSGKEFWMVPCNMRPEYGILINSLGRSYTNFDKIYNSFIYYNCDNERGRYPRFYIEES